MVRRMKRFALALVLLAACGNKKEPAPAVTPGSAGSAVAAPAPDAGAGSAAPALDLAGMNKAVKPGDDFFAFANGTWFGTTEIPADRSSWGSGAITAELTQQRLRELLEAAANAPAGSEARKIGDYYATFMDEAAIDAKGLAPLQPDLDRVAAIKDAKDLARAIGETLRADVDVINATNFETPNLFGVWIAQDLRDPAKYSTFLLQGGLGMPSRDFYIDASPRMAEIRGKYEAHIAKMLDLAKLPGGAAAAKRIFDLEMQIAKAHVTRVESEDVKNGLTHWSRADFDTKAPGLDWGALFDGAQLGKQTDFVVWHPKATTGIAAVVKSVPVATWREYLAFRAVERAAPYMPKAFVDESFAFYGTTLAGTPTLRERWKRGVDASNAALGEAIGKLYVAKYFSDAAKHKIRSLVTNIIAAFDKRIDALAWMAPATKAKAKAKLAALKVGVGYPDKWRDYAGLDVQKGDALGNARRSALFEYQYNLAKLGTPVDRDEWVMVPQLVNAVNLPAMNALNFPAAILQPPYFDPLRPEAMDYGSIGAVIGHEISHSFDDQGAQFDDTGRLQDWWTKDDYAHFKAQGAALEAQFNAYKPFPDLAVNGKQTLSENIADVAGLAAAYDAYRLSLGKEAAPAWQGLTGDQQFFISFGQSWRTKYREPLLRRLILTDGHSPGEFRADTARNLDAWYQAFDVKPGEKLYLDPKTRVRVW
jgi:putative endopeptidase